LLTVEGDHVPVIAGVLVELVGNVGAVVPLQKAGIAAKVGVVVGVVSPVIVIDAVAVQVAPPVAAVTVTVYVPALVKVLAAVVGVEPPLQA
jgi:hypothetical protein